jgi:hypothetical protein|tara:strand:- start:96 stop:344 length:249 start_codon:yes stop_codon:yes gene_type:complete
MLVVEVEQKVVDHQEHQVQEELVVEVLEEIKDLVLQEQLTLVVEVVVELMQDVPLDGWVEQVVRVSWLREHQIAQDLHLQKQ